VCDWQQVITFGHGSRSRYVKLRLQQLLYALYQGASSFIYQTTTGQLASDMLPKM